MNGDPDDTQRHQLGPAAWLVDGGGTPWPIPMHLDEVSVGRQDGADLWVDDPNVSRRHATLRREGGSYAVADVGSRNGTFVNDRRIDAVTRLEDGDRVRVGATTWVFRRDSSSAHSATPSSTHRAPPSSAAPASTSASPPGSKRRSLGKVLVVSAAVSVLGIVANSLTTVISHSGNQWFRWLLAPAATVVFGMAATVLGEWGNAAGEEATADQPTVRGRPAPAPRRRAGGAMAGALTVLLVLGVGGLAVTAGARAVVGQFSSVDRLAAPAVGGNSKVRLTVTRVLQGRRSTSIELTGLNSSKAVVDLPAGFAHLTGSDGTTLDVDVLGSHWSGQLTPGIQQRGTLKFDGHFADDVASASLSFTFGDTVTVKTIRLVPPPS